MALVEPGKGRVVIEHGGSGLRITIPAAMQTFGVIFMLMWLSFWAVGEIAVLRHFLGGQPLKDASGNDSLFLVVWFTGWTLGGALMIYSLLWQLVGKEIIELNSTMLRRRKRIFFFSRSKDFAVAGITNIRLALPQPKYIRGKYVISSPMTRTGAIAFDFGRSTHHLGHGLDETEARYVIAQLCERVKSLCFSESDSEGES